MFNAQREAVAGAILDPHHQRVTFVCRDVAQWTPPQRESDLVVSNFFLDCFRADEIEQIVGKVCNALTDDASWLIADFCEPRRGWKRWRARAILHAMYAFFRRATNLPATNLTAPDAILTRHGFELRARRTFEWGLLQSDLWSLSVCSLTRLAQHDRAGINARDACARLLQQELT